MRRAALYLRVSTTDQTTANQERELMAVAGRMDHEIIRVYRDHGVSGAKGRDKRPQFDALCKDASTGFGHDDTKRKSHVPNDGGVCRVREGHDPGTCKGWSCQSESARQTVGATNYRSKA